MSPVTDLALMLSRSAELSILAKTTLLFAAGLITVAIAARVSASLRHLALAVTIASVAVLPLVVTAVPTVGIEVSKPVPSSRNVVTPAAPIDQPSPAGINSPAPSASVAPRIPRSTLLRGAWFVGALLFLVPVVVGLWRLRRIRRQSLPWIAGREMLVPLAQSAGVRRAVDLLLHENVPAPLTFGTLRPAILLPADAPGWNDAELRRALAHELEHVRRHDWITQIAARSVCALYWFHPLAWAALRRMCLEAERSCDDAVLRAEERADYADQLVTLARRMSVASSGVLLGMAQRSDLAARVSSILDDRRSRSRANGVAAATAMLVAGVVVVGLAPLRAVAQESRDPGGQAVARRANRSSALDRALVETAEDGDVADITRLLDSGAHVNAEISGDGTPLIVAARRGHFAAVKLLLDRGADPNLPVSGDGNPLIMAASEGHTDVITLLLDRGANLHQIVPGDENAIIQAAAAGHLSAVKLLISRGADMSVRVWVDEGRNGKGEFRSPLSEAKKRKRDAVVQYLQSIGARE